MHNSPGMQPLDSRTYTGKVVDRIIEDINTETIKTNLAEIEAKPLHPAAHAEKWHEKHSPKEGDVVVLLGKWVWEHFEYKDGLSIVVVNHPSAVKSRQNHEQYIDEVVEKITVHLPLIISEEDDLPF